MGRITVDQSHQVVATLVTNTAWEEIDFEGDGLQDSVIRNAKEAGRQFTAFLRNGGRMLVNEARIIPIDRNQLFDPVKFLGQGWGIEEQDERSLVLTQIDLSKVQLVNMLKKGEDWIKGEERLRRLKDMGYIRLDARVFQTLWEDQLLIPESWKKKINGNITLIFFDGTILCAPNGYRGVLCLCWSTGRWYWSYDCLGDDWDDSFPSAVLVGSS